MAEEMSTLELGHILIHPIRYQIVRSIREKGRLYINQMADMLDIDRKVVSFHLSTLSQYGFVESEYEVLKIPHSKGKAAKYFRLTDKVDEVLANVKTELEINKNL
jgi:predicted ArsR family transcriptional regulator